MNPWHPMTDQIDKKTLGKLGEELGECTSAAMRCFIQGIDEREPVTGKLNREWIEDEIADVLANCELTMKRFNLDRIRIAQRQAKKEADLAIWHAMA